METYINPARGLWTSLCRRPVQSDSSLTERVRAIMEQVRSDGDDALKALSLKFDGVALSEIKVSEAEIEAAKAHVSDKVKAAVEQAYANVYAFHKAQMPRRIEVETAPGVTCIQKPVPIGSVGLYIPGGTAPLFSTVLMLAVPALIAGCPRRILCTPCRRDGTVSPEVLYTASRCGITDIYKVGGAQAVAAMAYGTQTVPAVDKIFGPGNRYVTEAKKIVSGEGTAIDMPAGPSEVMVLADETAVPAYVAADLLSQAEHGRDSQVILVCTDEAVARAALAEVGRQAALLPREAMVEGALGYSRTVIFDSVEDILAFADAYAPEHLIISMKDADAIAERVNCAGSVFIGNYSPESAGDYASGTNHTLPTSGWARSCSGVNIDSFIRKMTLQKLSREGLASLSDTIIAMAEAEGLQAHANAVKVRTDE